MRINSSFLKISKLYKNIGVEEPLFTTYQKLNRKLICIIPYNSIFIVLDFLKPDYHLSGFSIKVLYKSTVGWLRSCNDYSLEHYFEKIK